MGKGVETLFGVFHKLKIALTGASGFIGSALLKFLQKQGIEVVLITRTRKGPTDLIWGELTQTSLDGVQAVVHLAGESISGLWTKVKKGRILESRLASTKALVTIFSKCKKRPPLFLSASAIGFYGDRGEETLTENSVHGHGFLADVARLWEEASMPLKDLGVRLIHARLGIVLGKEGGMLKKLLLLHRLGLGARFGSGKQWISWIALIDVLRAVQWMLKGTIDGPVNLSSPNPLRQKEFSQIISMKMGKKVHFTLPAWLLHLMLGQMGDELLLSSTKAVPQKLLDEHFFFLKPTLANISYIRNNDP